MLAYPRTYDVLIPHSGAYVEPFHASTVAPAWFHCSMFWSRARAGSLTCWQKCRRPLSSRT
jgi:hypothetical protein